MSALAPGEPFREAATPETAAPPPAGLSAEERCLLLQLARQTLMAATAGSASPEPPPDRLTPPITQRRPCFVTLTQHGCLRGCIGHLASTQPLWQAVIENSRWAALRDPRFPPVCSSELAEVEIEISVLTEPQPLAFTSPDDLLGKLQPGRDGVVLESGWHRATFLPQVWEDLPDKAVFLSRLCQKGGWSPNAWREPGLSVSTYRVEAFHEPGPGGGAAPPPQS